MKIKYIGNHHLVFVGLQALTASWGDLVGETEISWTCLPKSDRVASLCRGVILPVPKRLEQAVIGALGANQYDALLTRVLVKQGCGLQFHIDFELGMLLDAQSPLEEMVD